MIQILAIDDDPGRYDHLIRLLGDRANVSVVACPRCVVSGLVGADAVLLDHDLNGRDQAWARVPCAGCGLAYVEKTTRRMVEHIARRDVPVIVTSASAPENRRWLMRALTAGGVRAWECSAVETDPELRWIGRLWAWGVL